MTITRRVFTLSGLASASLPAVSETRAPSRTGPLRILVAQPAGGVTDAFARAVAPELGRRLGSTAVVENMPGASGSIAASHLLNAPADGTTILVGSPSETVLAPLMLRAVRYQPTDFRLLGLINRSPLALYARSDLPANSLDELITLAHQRAKHALNYGSTGQGSLFHLVTETLLSATGSTATHVPYRGGVPMLNDLRAGRIDFTVLPVDALLDNMVAAGQMKVLSVFSAQRLARFPQVATVAEGPWATGIAQPGIWVGLLVPASVSDTISAQLHTAAIEALADAQVRRAIGNAGGSVPPPMSLQEAGRFYAADEMKLRSLVKAARVEPL
ncbi:tripartite tricarboxylate transporter substrate binding protein [Hydrogenophaga sp. 2FB]|uniref:Bug family tripartite tricarboxylate transporter substrate binding protein n=1 Tax=Hydrogenophaga sp. 2FB TaxID=2502187 RepID=UPI0010F7A34F|nr:tripartite tricarboxylate transporter substrate binding protein [Hydrogenophaga sp. 2FB]